MSSIAYKNLRKERKDFWLKIKTLFFDDMFRSCPTIEEHIDGFKGRLKMYFIFLLLAIFNFGVLSPFAALPVKIWQKCLETELRNSKLSIYFSK